MTPDGAGARWWRAGPVDAAASLTESRLRGELLLHNHPSGVLEPWGGI